MGNIELQSIEHPNNQPLQSTQKKCNTEKHLQQIQIIPSYRIKCRPQFYKNQPLNQQKILPNELAPEEEPIQINKQIPIADALVSTPSMLIDMMRDQDKKRGRIQVQWSNFVKIKRRNYLTEYIFMKELGRGAFGTVAKVRMKYGSQFRAAKILKETLAMKDPNQREKLYSQIAIPIELDHPSIAKLYEVFQWKQSLALVMQLCDGGDLFAYLRSQKSLTQALASNIMRQILSAVIYMHKRGVCHRDLKPENMLYDNQSGLLKIIDFGSAAKFTNGQSFTPLIGTPYYIAPQVIQGNYNQKCDVWSCGIVLYVILSGNPPFLGKSERQIMDKIKMFPVQFTNPIWAKRSTLCKDLLINMLCKDPSRRFSAEQALNSPWFTQASNVSPPVDIESGKQVISNLRNFHFQNKLKAVVYTYIASQLYSNKDRQALLRTFRQMDKDGDGVIERQQLMEIFSNCSTALDPGEVQRIIGLIDTNGSGHIDFTQFVVAASNQQQLLQKKQLQNAFAYLDTDHSGQITYQQVREFLDGTEQTGEQIKQIFKQVDQNGDGRISKNEFISLLVGK